MRRSAARPAARRNWRRGCSAGLTSPSDLTTAFTDSAREAGLRYVSDQQPGIRRVRSGKGFRYLGPTGKQVLDSGTQLRIRSLAIPPAWSDVWICPEPNGHLQARGRDARGRKQYRYHHEYRRVREQTKYDRLIAFGKALPRIRRKVEHDLARPGLPREKVLAAVVQLLDVTLIRVGNGEYARQNNSFGLTTMRDEHAKTRGSAFRFVFRGKGGVEHRVDIKDRRLARLVRRCQELPGEQLFQYVGEDGQIHDVTSADVNDYLRGLAGREFSAKDFRTWTGTVLASCALQEFQSFDTKSQAKRNIVRAIESVAKRLGNTPAVCRKCYVHPAVIDAYMEGALRQTLRRRVEALDGARWSGAHAMRDTIARLGAVALPDLVLDDVDDGGSYRRATRRR